MPKPKKMGRPKLPKGEAKGKIVAMRFSADELKRVSAAAKASKQNVSSWTRGMLMDFNMTKEDWNKVMSLFGKARDGYDRLGNHARAKECDRAIALVQYIALDPNLVMKSAEV